MRRLLLLLPLVGCLDRQALPPTSDEPLVVPVEVAAEAALPARLPSDLVPDGAGGAWVLDGVGEGIPLIALDAALQVVEGGEGTGAPGRSTRMAKAATGGHWVADPAGFLLRVEAGQVVETVALPPVEGVPVEPVALLSRDEGLLVSDRIGRLLLRTDEGLRLWGRLADEVQPAAVAVDLLALPDGGVLAADPVGGRLVPFSSAGERGEPWGRYGHWIGAVAAPKALALGPAGTVLVADSTLDVVQLFDLETQVPLGALAVDGEPLRPGHPIALEADGDGFLLLAARPARAWRLSLSADAVAAAREQAGVRRLRQRLLEPDPQGFRAASADGCATCHDGLVQSRAAVLLDGREHHPVDVAAPDDLPAFFPLSDDGLLTCGTCHSPHGTTHAGEALALTDTDARGDVKRTGGDDGFLRIGLDDDELCLACHGDAAHELAVELGGGGAHLSGTALHDALLARGDGDDLLDAAAGSCTDCHSVHGAEGPSLTADPAAGGQCVGCHTDRGNVRTDHPVGVGATTGTTTPRASAHLALGSDGSLACSSCHDLVGGTGEALLRAPDDGGLLCVACHDQRADLSEGAHAVLKGDAGVPCLSCHDVHGSSRERTLLRSRPGGHPVISTSADPTACTSCHDGPGRAGHPVTGQSLSDAQAAAARTGHGDGLQCQSCHDPHLPDLQATADDCGSCHEAPHAAAERGGHGGLACADCHPVHETSPMAARSGRDGACLSCHGAGTRWADADGAKAPRVSGDLHPGPLSTPEGQRWQVMAGLPLFDEAGAPVDARQPGYLACASCHLVHGPDADKARDHLRRDGWQDACAACHGDDALLLYRQFHDRTGGTP